MAHNHSRSRSDFNRIAAVASRLKPVRGQYNPYNLSPKNYF